MSKKIVVDSKKLFLGLGIIILLSFFAVTLIKITSGSDKENIIIDTESNGEVQTVKVSTNGLNYVFEPSIVKTGKVKFVLDTKNIEGCARAFNIPQLKVSKVATSKDNTITIDIKEEGTYEARCSMNMYKGKFTVK